MAQRAAALCAERARERGDAAAAEAVARQMELKQAAERAAFDERADGSEPGIGEVGPNLEDEDVLQSFVEAFRVGLLGLEMSFNDAFFGGGARPTFDPVAQWPCNDRVWSAQGL